MKRVLAIALMAAGVLAAGGKKAPPAGRGESESVEVTATAFSDKEAVKELLGADLDGYYTVLQVQIRSRFGKEIDVHRDDFLLRTDHDGDKSTPFVPSQIAGRGALVVSEKGYGGGGIGVDVWGGGFGNGGSGSEAQARLDTGAGQKRSPLMKLLNDRMLPEGKTDKSLSGLLYFPLGKQKPKDLELIYTAADGKIRVRFK